jgi:hypothetical protein
MKRGMVLVQFIHPGKEHKPNAGGRKSWNTGDHRRKFMATPGRYVPDGQVHAAEIGFWGEWEPESEVVRFVQQPVPGGPRYVYRPFYRYPTSYTGQRLQNTDPFVFGDRFLYTGCKQYAAGRPTGLRFMERGSVVLFGSSICGRFCLDTVFVVSHWIDHDRSSVRQVLKDAISPTYAAVTISPWYREDFRGSERGQAAQTRLGCGKPVAPERETGCGTGDSFRLYFGATWEEPVDGMFSFFPCVPLAEAINGFARPEIAIAGSITDNLTQGQKFTDLQSPVQAKRLWDEVVRQVQAEGLAPGVHAALPPGEA